MCESHERNLVRTYMEKNCGGMKNGSNRKAKGMDKGFDKEGLD